MTQLNVSTKTSHATQTYSILTAQHLQFFTKPFIKFKFGQKKEWEWVHQIGTKLVSNKRRTECSSFSPYLVKALKGAFGIILFFFIKDLIKIFKTTIGSSGKKMVKITFGISWKFSLKIRVDWKPLECSISNQTLRKSLGQGFGKRFVEGKKRKGKRSINFFLFSNKSFSLNFLLKYDEEKKSKDWRNRLHKHVLNIYEPSINP